MQEIMTLMIFVVCFLGICVTRLSNKIKKLEHELLQTQYHIEKENNDILRIIQNSAEANVKGYAELTELVSKQVTDDMQKIGDFENKFNNLEKYVFESVRIITDQIEKMGK